MKTVETVNVKQLASHELSVEQQLYFKEITEVGGGIVAVPENFEPDPGSGLWKKTDPGDPKRLDPDPAPTEMYY